MPRPKHPTLAELQGCVTSPVFYWIQHGRITVVPSIWQIDGSTVPVTDGTQRLGDGRRARYGIMHMFYEAS